MEPSAYQQVRGVARAGDINDVVERALTHRRRQVIIIKSSVAGARYAVDRAANQPHTDQPLRVNKGGPVPAAAGVKRDALDEMERSID